MRFIALRHLPTSSCIALAPTLKNRYLQNDKRITPRRKLIDSFYSFLLLFVISLIKVLYQIHLNLYKCYLFDVFFCLTYFHQMQSISDVHVSGVVIDIFYFCLINMCLLV